MTIHKATGFIVSFSIQKELMKIAKEAIGNMEDAAKKCIASHSWLDRKTGYTMYRFSCKKHLWSVEGTDKERARQEAMRYFLQYWSDGEYKDLVEGPESGERG
jgi:hypothetical protein